jgi:hypothetical protein
MEDLKKIFVEQQIKTITEVDVIMWAGTAVESAGSLAENPDILELASINKSNRLEFKRVGPLLANAIEGIEGGFSLDSPEAEAYAQEGFRKQCQRLVEGSIEPYDLCRCVFPIESLFHSPRWLGNFPKLCEPIEPGTPAEAVPDLVRSAEGYLSA